MSYFVVRTYSHTDRQQLWKVMSRPIYHKEDAEAMKEYLEGDADPRQHQFFVVSREDTDA